MNLIGHNRRSKRSIHLFILSALDPSLLPDLPEPYFGVFLACDATLIPDPMILDFAAELLKRGLVYIDSWGPDCERVDHLFDVVIVQNDPDETGHTVRFTTWHTDRSLDEALWHFLNVSFPARNYRKKCRSEIFLVIGDEGWAKQIRGRVSNQKLLDKEKYKIEKRKKKT